MKYQSLIRHGFLLSFLATQVFAWQYLAHAHEHPASGAVAHEEKVHNHVSLHGGQVGMSGDYHVEFVIKNDGEYRLYITDFMRKPVDISKAKGSLVINPEKAHSENLDLSLDEALEEFLLAKGNPRSEGDEIYASARIEIPGQEPVFIEFLEKIGSSKIMESYQ